MTASLFERCMLRVKSSPVLARRPSSLVTLRQRVPTRFFSSALKSRGFSNVLRFTTIQPSGGQLTPADFRFKAALVINSASRCTHASQLKQLQILHEKYSEQGLVVVAVPSNDFAGQEPGNSDEILKRYAEFNVTFDIAHKTSVTGEEAHPFFKKIADEYSTSVAPTWNFDKFLVDHHGEMRAVFPNDTEPLMKEVVAEIEKVLEELPRALEPGQVLEEDEEGEYEDEDEDSEEREVMLKPRSQQFN